MQDEVFKIVQGDQQKGKPSKNKNYDYSDIVPVSFDPLPSEGDRDSKDRDNINSFGPPSLPPVVGTYKLELDVQMMLLDNFFIRWLLMI